MDKQPDLTRTNILHRTPWRPPTAVGGEGIYIQLENGPKIIDGVGGAAVACLGMGNTKVTKAITEQLGKLAYVYNCQLTNKPAEDLANRLIADSRITPADPDSTPAFSGCFFVSGGSEALEAVIKLVRQYFYETGQPQRRNFIARELSYHGNTLGALALAQHPARRAPYEALMPQAKEGGPFQHVSPVYAKRWKKEGESDEEYVKRLAQEVEDKFQELGPDTVAAFVAEPVVGATQGITYAPRGYFKAISEICKKHGALLVYDEVMCGMGRMGGTLHAWQNPAYTDGVPPDIQAIAKGLGGGYASIGAVLFSSRIEEGIKSGSGWLQHGHTYQAHPLSCAASLAVQDVIKEENLLEQCELRGNYLGKLLREGLLTGPNALSKPWVFDVRGGGLFWGVEFEFSEEENQKWFAKGGKGRFGTRVQQKAMELELIIIGMSGGVDGVKGDHIILSPAYTVTELEVEAIVRRTVEAVEAILDETVLSKQE